MSEGILHVELCSPDHPPVSVEAAELVIPGSAGVFTVLPGHTPLLSTLSQGVLIALEPSGERRFFSVHGGFAEVKKDRISILGDVMEQGEEIDTARAEAAMTRAQGHIEAVHSHDSVKRAELALARAKARLQAHGQEDY